MQLNDEAVQVMVCVRRRHPSELKTSGNKSHRRHEPSGNMDRQQKSSQQIPFGLSTRLLATRIGSLKSQSLRVVIRHVAVAVFIVSLAALRNTNGILTVAFGPVAASASHGKLEEVVCRARLAFGILVAVTTDVPFAPEGGLLIGALIAWALRRDGRRP